MAQTNVVQDNLRKEMKNPYQRQGRLLRTWNHNKTLWLLFLPCLLYYLIFRYAPMFGLVITFKDYNLFKGIWASDWVGLKYYRMFLRILTFGR